MGGSVRLATLMGLGLALLAACGHPGMPVAPSRLAAAEVTAAKARLAPEQAEAKARKKAVSWHADARLIGVVWAVPKLELASVVHHVFRSPRADKLLAVETKLTSWWQGTREIADRKLTLPARALAELGRYPVDAKGALAIAKAQLPPGTDKPLALLALGRAKIGPPLWGAQADQARVLIHAETGKVLLGGGEATELLLRVVEPPVGQP